MSLRPNKVQVLTIANGAATSDAFENEGHALLGMVLPASMTSTSMTFTVSEKKDGTYVALYDSGNNQVSMTIASSRAYDLPAELAAFPYFKLVGGSNETGAKSITVVGKS